MQLKVQQDTPEQCVLGRFHCCANGTACLHKPGWCSYACNCACCAFRPLAAQWAVYIGLTANVRAMCVLGPYHNHSATRRQGFFSCYTRTELILDAVPCWLKCQYPAHDCRSWRVGLHPCPLSVSERETSHPVTEGIWGSARLSLSMTMLSVKRRAALSKTCLLFVIHDIWIKTLMVHLAFIVSNAIYLSLPFL